MFILFSTITHFYTLCVLSLIISFFSEAFRPANFAAIATYANPGTTTRSYSLNRLATNLGWTVSVSLGGIIASYNYKLLFVVDGSVSIIAGLCILFLLPYAAVAAKAEKDGIVPDRTLVFQGVMALRRISHRYHPCAEWHCYRCAGNDHDQYH
jgi:MFS family permease